MRKSEQGDATIELRMNDEFELLVRSLGDVDSPEECPSLDDWIRVEKDLGLKLPEDYKQFVSRFGSCWVMNVLILDNPAVGTISRERLINGGRGQANYETVKRAVREAAADDDINLYPEENGLLRFGSADDGALFWANTASPPEEWVIRVTDYYNFQHFDVSFTKFMLAFIEGKLTLPGVAQDAVRPPAYKRLE